MQTMYRCGTRRCLGAVFATALLVLAGGSAQAEPQATTFKLKNGMEVVVIPDHRVPVVTHMVWYRAGAGDDPWGTSGIAHFLEHLMFKSTGKIKSGEFTRIITQLGGRDNAQTTHDTTAYFQRVAKQHLRRVMELEADRMVNLKLIAEEVRTERDVIQEERRSNVDANPLAVLSEQMLAALYQNHPYGRPALGWAREMAKLSLQDAQTFTGGSTRLTMPSSWWRGTLPRRKFCRSRRQPMGATRPARRCRPARGRRSLAPLPPAGSSWRMRVPARR